LAAQSSLQRCEENKLDEKILTPTGFYNICKKNIVNIEFVYASNKDYEGDNQLLQARHSLLLVLKRLYHFQPMRIAHLYF
jgi:endonuclease III-like uncharacterized protein